MTRKHYAKMAAAIRDRRFVNGTSDPARRAHEAALDGIAKEMAEVFASDNPRFDADRFIDATKLLPEINHKFLPESIDTLSALR